MLANQEIRRERAGARATAGTLAAVVCTLALPFCANSFSQPRQNASPRVPLRFNSEAARLAAEGLRIRETFEVTKGGRNQLAIVLERDKPTDLSTAYEIRILESDGEGVRTIFRRADFFFSFSVAGAAASLNGSDINADGLVEVLVQSSSGGNCWSCNPIEVYQLGDRKALLIAAGPITRIADLDGDGVMELVVADARWESYGDLSHAASPAALMIYAWRAGRYVYTSSDYPSFYKTEIERVRSEAEEAEREITAADFSDDIYIGRAVALALTYAHSGELERGLAEMETLLRSAVRSESQSKRRTAIIDDFRKGEASKKLREMKTGDPMPLG